MTGAADNQGFPSPGGHHFDPGRFFPLSLLLQIGEFADVMYFTVFC